MPNQPKTPIRSVRVPDAVWQAAQVRAEAEDTTVSAVVVAALKKYGKARPTVHTHSEGNEPFPGCPKCHPGR